MTFFHDLRASNLGTPWKRAISATVD